MAQTPINTTQFFKAACNFEGSLILVAALLGWLSGVNPFAHLYFSERSLLYGILGTVPLFLMFLALEQVRTPPVQKIRSMLVETLGAGLQACHWTDLFLLAAIAGFSEELLFRGVLQPWVESAWGIPAGLVVSNFFFGLVHAITPLYALLAALVGIYLGLAFDYGGERNLLTPIVIHGLYDFLAFMMIMKSFRRSK